MVEQELREQAGVSAMVRWSSSASEPTCGQCRRPDVLVVPSRVDEPFGNTAVEGILARRPVVASDMSGLRRRGGYLTTRLGMGSGVAPTRWLTPFAAWRPTGTPCAHSSERSASHAVARHAPAIYRASIRDALSALSSSARGQRSDV